MNDKYCKSLYSSVNGMYEVKYSSTNYSLLD